MKKLSMIGFISLSITMIMDIYEYPVFATSGLQLIFFVIIGGILWFMPAALCSAEMATVEGWQSGGIFSWVSNTLGERFGFVAIFFQWFQATVGFVTMLYFIVGALSYVTNINELTNNPVLKFITIITIFWILTFIQTGGVKKTEAFAKYGFYLGIIIPSVVLVILSISYIISGAALQVDFSIEKIIPDFSKPNTFVIFVAFILSFMGVEASASYVNELDNPNKNYPIAMIIIVIIAILLNSVGGLAIASVIPNAQLTLDSGIIQTYELLIIHFSPQLIDFVKVLALLIVFGVMAEISSWIIGPARGMYSATQKGLLPPFFRKVNKNDVPINLIFVQGIIVTIWSAILTLGGGGNNLSFLVAISLTVGIYVIAYLLLFIGYFKLLFKMSNLQRSYNVPGGKIGKICIATAGFLSTLAAFIISFIPPSTLKGNEVITYQIILVISFIISITIPFIIYQFHDKNKHIKLRNARHYKSEDINKYVDPIGRGEHHINPDEEDYI